MNKQQLIEFMLVELREYKIHPNIDLSHSDASSIKIADLAMDSLEFMHFAMAVEDALSVELDVVDFPNDARISDVADHFLALLEASG